MEKILIMVFYLLVNVTVTNDVATSKIVSSFPKPTTYIAYNDPPIVTPIPTLAPSPLPSPTSKPIAAVQGVQTSVIPTQEVKADTSFNSIHAALNIYRQKNGKSLLRWNSTLAKIAQERANHYSANSNLDNHDGFNKYRDNPDEMKNLGFWGMAENSSYNNSSDPTTLIEDVFAHHDLHNTIQLDPSWTDVGVGVSGAAVDVVFAR